MLPNFFILDSLPPYSAMQSYIIRKAESSFMWIDLRIEKRIDAYFARARNTYSHIYTAARA